MSLKYSDNDGEDNVLFHIKLTENLTLSKTNYQDKQDRLSGRNQQTV
jgi:hypothetical protein